MKWFYTHARKHRLTVDEFGDNEYASYWLRYYFISMIALYIYNANLYCTNQIYFEKDYNRKSKLQNNLCFMQKLILIMAPDLCFFWNVSDLIYSSDSFFLNIKWRVLKECRNEASIHNSHSLLSNPHTTKMN